MSTCSGGYGRSPGSRRRASVPKASRGSSPCSPASSQTTTFRQSSITCVSWSSSAAYSRAPSSPRASRAAATSSGRQASSAGPNGSRSGTAQPATASRSRPATRTASESLEQIRGRGINPVADSVAQSADHVQELLQHAAARARLLPRLPQPARQARRETGEPTCFPEPLAAGQLTLTAQGIYDVVPDAPPRKPGHRQRRECRWQVAGDDHRCQPGRQVDPAAQPRPRPADDAGRHVRRCPVVPRRRLPRCLHPLQARRGRHDGERQARRGTQQDERDRRPDHAPTRSCCATSRSPRPTSAKARRSPGRSSARCSASRSRSSSSPTCTTSRHSFYAQQLEQRPVPARRAAAGRAADVQADRGRAAADQLRRRLLPAHLRHCRTNAGARRRDQTVTPRAVPASRRRVKSCPRPPGELAANIELREGAAFPGRGRFAQQRHCARHVPVGGEASGEPVSSAAQARGYLVDVHPIPRPE